MKSEHAANLELVAKPPVVDEMAKPVTERLPEPPVPVQWGPRAS